MIHHYAKTSLLTFILSLFVITLNAQVIAPFSSIYQTNQRGGIVFLSNAALGCSSNPPVSTPTCQAGVNETPLLGTTRNDNFSSTFIDIDGDGTTFMSSSDRLDLPTCSHITRAILFWGASGANTAGFNQVKLKLNSGAYQVVTASVVTTNTTGFNSYHCYADVTGLLSQAGIADRVTIADIHSAAVGLPNTFGSWNLAVVYQNDNMTMRQLTVFNGLSYHAVTSPTINLPLSGFLAPATGSVGFEVGVYAHDGDRGMTGDNLMFNGNLTFLPLTDLTTNIAADVMNSSVSNNGVMNAFRNPLLNNTMGSDADIYVPLNLLNLYLANAATTATLQFIAGSDDYITQAVTTAIDTQDPEPRASIRSRDVNGGTLNPGDVVEYKVRGFNTGNDNSVNTFITDTLDPTVNYIPNSTSIVFGPNGGAKTDAVGDDQVDYNPATRILKIRIGTTANAATGGNVAGSPTGVDSTVVSYSVTVSQSCLKLSCFNSTIRARAYITGSGTVTPAQTFTNASRPGTLDGFGCPALGPISSTVTTSSCASATAASTSPACTGGTLTLSATNDPEATYAWSGPNGFTSTAVNPTLAPISPSLNGVYTVTLTTPGTSCTAVASTTVNVTTCTPVAVNDFTNTTVNIPVIANAATNDINAIPGGTFSIVSQSPNGTVAINPSTGQYTFTPVTGFTGVATATYMLCNSLPVICSTASITFTVYANVVANPDVINTTPSVTANGNLMTNDGTTAGASYSLTFMQLPAAVGSLTVNSTTGQYTFAPNPTFVGTSITTYTLCNISVNPQQCSNTTITVNVKPNPAPVNDNTTTVVNTTVSGNAAANDVGATSGTFAIVTQPANGTISINSVTGIYSFTPATSFTGVTTATYQLCNGAPTSCSNAVISITVYPNLVANPDVINTTPSVTANGNLMTNDGTTAGASYSLTFTQLPAAVGSLTVNSTTGQYTFAPNPTFVGTSVTSYTLCNISVNPTQCSNTTVTVNVLPNPAPVNDNTTTVINTTVSGNAAANDVGATGGTFAIVTQPANGAISINSVTGVYSFTPATSFTGVTTATYQLCNGAPTSCSNAVISITVYPNLVANADVINTTPGTPANGNLLTNDIGITTGGTYAVTFTQLLPLTGTLTVNAATGQYTFTPNPLFIGSAQTSYTVCNTGVNPQQCSTATISINVSNFPVAVNDGAATVMNTPVAGNAAANDSGTFGGTYTFGTLTTGTGTFIGGSATGFYSYTPATGFTGTASVTYTLCNLSSPPCSTAIITFTVYPDLVANPDVIVSAPSFSVSGNLLANDTGIIPGANYLVIASPVLPTTGTLIVDPATGNYTFTPDAAFIGNAQTSYTVCNQSVIPAQCSSANVSITVQHLPVAVNDENYTLMGTAVSGDASANDSYTTNGTYSFNGPSPITGTLTGDPATGQYTFTPFSGFTDVTYASYSLCTINSAPCATALITLTVYPTIMAQPDVITTVENTTVSGNIMVNDFGTLQGGSYSVAITAPASSVGNINVNATTGQYTFTPATGYFGISTTTYTLSQYNGTTALQSSTAQITIVVKEATSPIGIAKSISNVSYNTNGTFYLTYKIVVKNYSSQALTSVSVDDNLSSTFFAPTTYTLSSAPMISNPSGSQLTMNSSYTGTGTLTSLTSAAGSSLAPGRADTILFTVKVDPHNYQFTYNNSANASAATTSATASDASVNGIDPDPDGDGDPANNNSSTPFSFDLVKIGIAKYTGRSGSDGNGCSDATFKFTVKNYGASTIYNIQVFDNLDNTFGAANYTVLSPPTTANGYLVPDNLYNGSNNNNLVSYNSQLGVGKTDTVMLHVRYCQGSRTSFSNTATAYGNSMPGGGFIGYDISTTGLDPDPDHNNNPSEDSTTVFLPADAFQIPQGFSPNNDGKNDFFEIKGIDAYPQIEVSILNRWGTQVYNKKQYDNTWDGKSTEGVEFGGNDLPEGTYFYIVDLGNGQKPLKGFVYLNRAVR